MFARPTLSSRRRAGIAIGLVALLAAGSVPFIRTAAEAAPDCTKQTLSERRGSRGYCVTQAQGFLGIRKDGVFGSSMKKSVIAYQNAKGLTPDGSIGPSTWRVLSGRAAFESRAESAAAANSRVIGSGSTQFRCGGLTTQVSFTRYANGQRRVVSVRNVSGGSVSGSIAVGQNQPKSFSSGSGTGAAPGTLISGGKTATITVSPSRTKGGAAACTTQGVLVD